MFYLCSQGIHVAVVTMVTRLVVLFILGLGQAVQDLGSDIVMDDVLKERTKQLLEDDNFDLSSSLVHSRITRNSSCPGVTEDIITYR